METAAGGGARDDRSITVGRECIAQGAFVLGVHVHHFDFGGRPKKHPEGRGIGELAGKHGAAPEARALVALGHGALVLALDANRKRRNSMFGIKGLPFRKDATRLNFPIAPYGAVLYPIHVSLCSKLPRFVRGIFLFDQNSKWRASTASPVPLRSG